MENQCKCGSLDFFIEKKGNNTGLYCSMCGKWQKWMNKDEIILFEHNNKPKKKKQLKQNNASYIRAMSDEELAEFLRTTVYECGDNLFQCDGATSRCLNKDDCTECYLKWLKMEAKEE